MTKPTINIPYSVKAAKDLYQQGVEAGIAATMEYLKSKREAPKIGIDILIESPNRDYSLNAMTYPLDSVCK